MFSEDELAEIERPEFFENKMISPFDLSEALT